ENELTKVPAQCSATPCLGCGQGKPMGFGGLGQVFIAACRRRPLRQPLAPGLDTRQSGVEVAQVHAVRDKSWRPMADSDANAIIVLRITRALMCVRVSRVSRGHDSSLHANGAVLHRDALT